MGRCKDFEKDEALKKALACFLENGYQATSTRDLAKAMDISYGSVYHTFQNKRSLYLASLDLYICQFITPLIEKLDTATSAPDTLTELFQSAAREAVTQPSGCLIGNSIMLLAKHDDDINRKVQRMNSDMEYAIERLLRRSRPTGNHKLKHDLRSTAHFMVTTLFGIRMVAQLDCDQERIDRLIEVALSVI